jgi:hypothetical protein
VRDTLGPSNAVGVDPERGGTHRMTSDAFFEHNNVQVSQCLIVTELFTIQRTPMTLML